MKHLSIFNCIAFCLAQDFGNFLLQSQLTTFSNTLVDQTIYVLPPDDTGSSPPSSPNSPPSNGLVNSPIVSTSLTFTTPGPASPSSSSLSPASSVIASSSPAPPFFTSSPESFTIFSPSLTTPTITAAPPVASSLSGVSSTSSGCSALEVTQFFTEAQTRYLTLFTTQIVEATVTSRYYPNTTSSLVPADSSSSFSATSPSLAASPSPVDSLCGNAIATITHTVYQVEDVQSILFDVGLPPLYGAYETSVNSMPVLYIHQLATESPVWPYHYNGFPVNTVTSSNQPPHQIVPSSLTTGSYDFTTAFSTNPPIAQATSAFSSGGLSSAASSGGPLASLASEFSLLPLAPLSTSIDPTHGDTTNSITPLETSLILSSIASSSTSALAVINSTQPVNVFSSVRAIPTDLSSSVSYALPASSNIGGSSPTSTATASDPSYGMTIPVLSSIRTVQLSHNSIEFANPSTFSSADSLFVSSSSHAPAANPSSTSPHFEGYDCSDVDGYDDSMLLCKKNGQSKAKQMSLRVQVILYSFVLLFLTM